MPGVHVVPAENGAFHRGVTPPILAEPDSRSLSNYLAQRYWSGM